MFLICCNYLTALSHTNNIAGSGCENNRSKIALKILIKDESRQIHFYTWDYIICLLFFLSLFSTNLSNKQSLEQFVTKPFLK